MACVVGPGHHAKFFGEVGARENVSTTINALGSGWCGGRSRGCTTTLSTTTNSQLRG